MIPKNTRRDANSVMFLIKKTCFPYLTARPRVEPRSAVETSSSWASTSQTKFSSLVLHKALVRLRASKFKSWCLRLQFSLFDAKLSCWKKNHQKWGQKRIQKSARYQHKIHIYFTTVSHRDQLFQKNVKPTLFNNNFYILKNYGQSSIFNAFKIKKIC